MPQVLVQESLTDISNILGRLGPLKLEYAMYRESRAVTKISLYLPTYKTNETEQSVTGVGVNKYSLHTRRRACPRAPNFAEAGYSLPKESMLGCF